MVRVGDQGRRAAAAPDAEQEEAPATVDCGGKTVNNKPEGRSVKRLRIEKAEIGFAHDGERGHDNQHTFQHSREIFGFVMAIGMIRVRRHRAPSHGEKGGNSGRDIDDALGRVREKCDAPGDIIGCVFENEHQHADDDAANSQPDDLIHTSSLTLPGCDIGVAPRDVARPVQVSFFRLQLACIRNDVPHCSAEVTRRNFTGSLVVGEAGEIAYQSLMFPRPRQDLIPNTAEFERGPFVKATGFREYDARWLYPEEINLLGLEAVGLGLATLMRERGVPVRVVTGHDYRSYSAAVKAAVTTGLLAGGA